MSPFCYWISLSEEINPAASGLECHYIICSIGLPQQKSVPAPAFVTSTSLPHIPHLYCSPFFAITYISFLWFNFTQTSSDIPSLPWQTLFQTHSTCYRRQKKAYTGPVP